MNSFFLFDESENLTEVPHRLAGHTACDNYTLSTIAYKNTSTYTNRISSTSDFYKSLNSTVFSDFTSASVLDFRYASDLYEYALYQYNHDFDIYNSKDFGSSELQELYSLASEQQFAINSMNSQGGAGAISGRTLAAKVLSQFNKIVGSQGTTNKLSLM